MKNILNKVHIIFETLVGSQAYGTAHKDSDEDLKGVYVEPRDSLLTLTELPDQFSDERGDVVHYALRRFLDLALGANPNIIEILFSPEDCIRILDSAFQPVMDHRDIFITKQAYASHARYAQAQIKKARGQNKWVNNPQPQEVPKPREFCWFLSKDDPTGMPCRPQSLDVAQINIEECHVSNLEHAPHLYRIYHYGSSARGVFRGESIVCESIPFDDENTHFAGLLIFNEHAYKRAKLDHQNYWTWRRNRNDKRWETQENGQLDYDAKNLMHMFRLMLSAENILSKGKPIVRFKGAQLAFLKSILVGEFSYDALMEKADALSDKLEKLHAKSTLPNEPDREMAEKLLKQVTKEWESRNHA